MDIFPSHFPQSDKGSSLSEKENVIEITFGDGYTQSANVGINSRKQVIDLKWTHPEAKMVYDWLKPRTSVTPFKYTHWKDTERKYICRNLKYVENDPEVCITSCTFEETFKL